MIKNGVANFVDSTYNGDLSDIWDAVNHLSNNQWQYVCKRIKKPTHIKDFGHIGKGEYDIVEYVLKRTREIIADAKGGERNV